MIYQIIRLDKLMQQNQLLVLNLMKAIEKLTQTMCSSNQCNMINRLDENHLFFIPI